MKIVITGGAGFIGSHLSRKLISMGHKVVVIDTLKTGSVSNIADLLLEENFHFQEGSILDKELLASCFLEAEYVFHLAAAVGVFNIVKYPLESLTINIRGTENVLNVANECKVPVLITSSSEVYGKNGSDSLSESDDRILGSPTTLRWSYSEAKAIDESLAFAYHLEHGLETRIVRFFNTVGPCQVGTYGMVVPRFIESALRNEPLTIYGDGKQTRCFAHVYDVIEAVIAVAFSETTVGRVLNIGNNVEVSIHDLASKIIFLTGSKSEIQYLPYTAAYGEGFEDMERRVPNIDLIRQLVGWEPKRDLNQIINDVAEEMRKGF